MIRRAKTTESELLTQLSFASKAYWGYPTSYFRVWSGELTISRDYIEKNDVFVYVADGSVIAYYSIVQLPDDLEFKGVTLTKGYWLEHMFVSPESIGKGIGRELFYHLLKRCLDKGIAQIGVLSDPNAKGFYEKMGCIYQREYPSTIEKRTTPYLVFLSKNAGS